MLDTCSLSPVRVPGRNRTRFTSIATRPWFTETRAVAAIDVDASLALATTVEEIRPSALLQSFSFQ
jgi:hypothetical protein